MSPASPPRPDTGASQAGGPRARVLLLDNIDSFVFNLAQALEILGAEVVVRRNDALDVEAALALSPSHVVLSPGPGRPEEAGICEPLARACLDRGLPLLGVCLGHQALCRVLGAQVVPATALVHGEASPLLHDAQGLFAGQPQGLSVGRYHSLAVDPASLPPELLPTAHTEAGELMAVRHRRLPAVGLQFHPESVLTPAGPALLHRFLSLTPTRTGLEAA